MSLLSWVISMTIRADYFQYFRDPEATRKAFTGGSFHSGDLAVWHPDGSVAIIDRSKDIIISGGEVCLSVKSILDWFSDRLILGFGRMHRPWPLNKVRTPAFRLLSVRLTGLIAFLAELASHPHVLEVSVVARKHPRWGERPMAFVVLHPQHAPTWKGRQNVFEKDLKDHAKARLPGFACPEWVEIVPELPVSPLSIVGWHWLIAFFQKTSTGKIMKVELRKLVAKL